MTKTLQDVLYYARTRGATLMRVTQNKEGGGRVYILVARERKPDQRCRVLRTESFDEFHEAIQYCEKLKALTRVEDELFERVKSR